MSVDFRREFDCICTSISASGGFREPLVRYSALPVRRANYQSGA
jgi:hypothetical protein